MVALFLSRTNISDAHPVYPSTPSQNDTQYSDFQLQLAAADGRGAATPAAYLEQALSGGGDDEGRNQVSGSARASLAFCQISMPTPRLSLSPHMTAPLCHSTPLLLPPSSHPPLYVDDNNDNNIHQMRATIKAVFPDRDAFTLLRPMLLEEDLNRLDAVPFSQLRPEFKAQVGAFLETLQAKARPLAVGGARLSGRAYATLAAAYADALNGGAVPRLATMWEGVARAETQRAFDAAAAALDAAYAAGGAAAAARNEAALHDAHRAAVDAALAVLREGALGDAALAAEYEARLRAAGDARLAAARAELAASSEAAARALLTDAAARVAEAAAAPGAGVADVEAAVRRALADFDARAPGGAAKHKAALAFALDAGLGAAREVHARAVQERDDARRRAAEADKRAAKLRADAERASEAGGERADALQAELEAARRESAAGADAAAQLSARLAEAERRAAAAEAEASSLRTQLAAANAAAASAAAAAAAASARNAAPQPPASPMSPASPALVVQQGDARAAAAALPDDVGAMTMAELRQWVTEHRLEDEEFLRLAARRGAKKADYVAYVARRAGRG